jgi:hypothetical protein
MDPATERSASNLGRDEPSEPARARDPREVVDLETFGAFGGKCDPSRGPLFDDMFWRFAISLPSDWTVASMTRLVAHPRGVRFVSPAGQRELYVVAWSAVALAMATDDGRPEVMRGTFESAFWSRLGPRTSSTREHPDTTTRKRRPCTGRAAWSS